MYKKYLVTGATGFLGRSIIAELLKKKTEIYALVLPGDPLGPKLPKEVSILEGNVCHLDSLEDAFNVCDSDTCVIHCAGIVSVATKPGEALFRVNVIGTKNVLNLCVVHRVGKMIYVSSVHALPVAPKKMTIKETNTISAELVKGDYAKSKAMAMNLVLDAVSEGLNANIVLPSGIMGPSDIAKGSITQMIKSVIEGDLRFAVKGGYDFVDVRDVANGIVACSEHGKCGRSYILSGHYSSIQNIIETAQRHIGRKQKAIYLPFFLARIIAPIYERHCVKKSKPLFFTPLSVKVLASNGNFSNHQARLDFGFSPRPLEDTIRDMVCFLKNGVCQTRD